MSISKTLYGLYIYDGTAFFVTEIIFYKLFFQVSAIQWFVLIDILIVPMYLSEKELQ